MVTYSDLGNEFPSRYRDNKRGRRSSVTVASAASKTDGTMGTVAVWHCVLLELTLNSNIAKSHYRWLISQLFNHTRILLRGRQWYCRALCKFQNIRDCTTFEFRMSFGGIFFITTAPWLVGTEVNRTHARVSFCCQYTDSTCHQIFAFTKCFNMDSERAIINDFRKIQIPLRELKLRDHNTYS